MNPQALDQLREGKADCPSDLQLDRLHAGELGPEASQQLSAHIKGCDTCPARMQARQSGFDAFSEVDPRVLLAGLRGRLHREEQSERVPLRRWLRRFGLLVAPLAAAAAALGVVAFTGRPSASSGTPAGGDPVIESGEASGTRLKGGLALRVYRQAQGRSEEVLSGERFAPGDRLRFAVDLPHSGAVTILGIESDGDLYVVWPDGTNAGTGVTRPAGNGQELPGAVSLDSSPGKETLYLVHCPDSSEVPRCTSQGAGSRPMCPRGCSQVPFVIDKAP
jgi:hypothetical protein